MRVFLRGLVVTAVITLGLALGWPPGFAIAAARTTLPGSLSEVATGHAGRG